MIIVSLFCIALYSCKPKPVIHNAPTPVNLVPATARQVLYYDKYPATTEALSQVNLVSQVQGYITGIFFTEGTNVKKGQVLYEIDKRLYNAAVNAAQANLKVAQGNLTQAQQDADRYEYLNGQNAVARQQYDHAVIALQNAKNQVQSAQEAVKTATTNLTYSVITAPFDGTIGFSQVKMGNMVNPGQTILNTVSTNNSMAVDFLINEKQLSAFEALQNRRFSETDSVFTIILPDNTVYPYPGKISVIDRAVDPQTGSIKLRLEFPNPRNSLKAGMSCVVRVRNLEPAPVLVVPGKAIVEQMGEYFVFVAKDTVIEKDVDQAKQQSGEDDKNKQESSSADTKMYALQRKVQLGQTIGPDVIIKEGINEGDNVVVDGVQLLHDGSRVSVGTRQPAGKPTPAK